MPGDKPCENGGISIALLMIVSSLVIIILSTIDFHTGLIWYAPPRINAEIRYMVTIFNIAIMFLFTYCQYMQLRVRINSLESRI